MTDPGSDVAVEFGLPWFVGDHDPGADGQLLPTRSGLIRRHLDRGRVDRGQHVIAAEVRPSGDVERERLTRCGRVARRLDRFVDGECAGGVEAGVDCVVVITGAEDVDTESPVNWLAAGWDSSRY